MPNLIKSTACSVVLGISLLSPLNLGCYGQFALTQKVVAWNGRATNSPLANSLVMWGLIIIPVYELSVVGDILIFNTIEVFTGDNPIALNDDGSATFVHQQRRYRMYVRKDGPSRGWVEVAVEGTPAIRYIERNGEVHIADLRGSGAEIVLPKAHAHALVHHGTF